MARNPSWKRVFNFRRAQGRPMFIGDGSPVGFLHAHKGGAPVLREDSSWRTINGLFVNTRWFYVSVQFRRRAK